MAGKNTTENYQISKNSALVTIGNNASAHLRGYDIRFAIHPEYQIRDLRISYKHTTDTPEFSVHFYCHRMAIILEKKQSSVCIDDCNHIIWNSQYNQYSVIPSEFRKIRYASVNCRGREEFS